MNEQRGLPNALLKPASGILNGALTVDPTARAALGELAGRRIAVHIEDFALTIVAHIEAQGIELSGPVESPDAEVTGTLAQLAAAGRSGSPKGLSVSGDAELVHGLSRAMARLPAAAWERLAQTIGDVPARGLERLGAGLLSAFNDTRERLAGTLAEYLQYEVRAVVSRAELDDFLSAVDRLRDDAERLGKRFDRLERQ
ncbi:MAG: ubiquinone biosynthesis accessory factor UbiJ [Gammaproteobacteria bacterium]